MKSFIFKTSAVIFSLLLFLGLLEIVVRVFSLDQPRIGEAHPIYGFAHIPDRTEINKHGVRIDIGRHGFRGPTPTLEKAPGSMRVVLLGDSFVFASSIDYENTFAGVLNARFKKENKPIEVIDMGVDGYGTAQELLVYRHIARKYHPDLVILCFYVGNDLQNNWPPREHFPTFKIENGRLEPVPFEIRAFRRNFLRDFLRHHVRVYSYIPDLWRNAVNNIEHRFSKKTRQARLKENQAQFDKRVKKAYGRDALVGQGLDESWQVTLKIIETLKNEVEDDGGRLAIVTFPIITQVYDDSWKQLKDLYPPEATAGWDRYKPQEILERFANENHVIYMPVLKRMAMEGNTNNTEFYIPRNPHFNKEAYQFIADLMAPTIEGLYEEQTTGSRKTAPGQSQ